GRQRAHGLAQVLHQLGVLLRDAVHLADGLVDLFEPAGLYDRGGGDFAHDVGDALHRIDDFLHGRAGAGRLLGSYGDARSGLVDQALDLFGRLRALEGQVAYLAGNDGEAFAGFARAGGFHRGVQGQDVGLEGDAFDQGDDVRDLARAVA